ncbi:MAG: hypothetical protein KAH01_01570, partial [Caldisericia bacterium]|nr:hypothetical protein [Caldisericia bacterium]
MAIDKLPEDIVQRPEDISHDQPRIHTEPFFRDGQSEMKMILENVDNPITVGSAIVSIVIKRDGAALPANKGYFEDYQKVFQTQFKPFFIPATKGTYVAEVVFADSSKVYTTKPLVVEEAKEDDDVLACPMINSTAGGKVFYTIDVKDKKYVKRITVKYTNGSRDQVFEYKALQSAILHQNVVVGNANNTIVITGSNTFTAEVEFYNSLKTYITKPHGANGIIDKDSATFDLYYDDDFDDVDVNRHWWARMLRANFDSLAGVEKVEVLLTPYWDPARGVEFVEKTITQIDGLKSLQVEMNQSSHRAGLRRYKIYRRVNGSIVADIHSSYINAFTLVIGHWWYHNSMDKISSLGGVLNTHIFMHSGSKDELSPADMKILIPSDNIFIDIRKTTGTKERDLPFTLDYGEKGNVSKNRINVSVDLSSISQEDRMYIIWNELHCLTKTLVDRNDPTSIIDGTFNEAHSLRRFDNRVIVPKKFEMRPIDVNAIVENGICKIRTASKFDSLVSETKYSTVAKNADGAGLTSELTNLENMNWIRHYQPYINTKLIKPKIGATLNISQAAVYKDDHARQEITASFDMPIVNELSGSHYKLEPYFHTKLLVNGVPTYTPIPFNADGEQDIYLDFAEPLEVYVLEKNKQGQKYVQVKMMYHDDVSYNALTPSPTAYGRAKAIHIKMREYHGLLHDVSRPVLPLDEMNQFAIGTNTVDGLPENRKAGHSGYYSNHELNEYGVETSDGVQLPPEFLKSYISRKQMSYTFSPTTGIDVSLLDPSLYPSDGELRMEPDQANTENKKATGKWFGMVQYPDSKYSGITPVLNVRVDKFGNKTPHKLALVSNQLAMDGKTSVELSLTIDEVMPSAIQSENADFSAHLWYRPNDVNGRFEKIKIFNGRVDNKTITADDFKINGVPSNRFKIAIGSDLASIGSYFFQVNFSNTQDFKSSGVVGSGPFDIPDFQNPYKVQVSNTITLIKAMDSSIEYYPNDDSVIQIASMLEFKFEERTVNGVVEKYATNIPNSLIQLDDKDNILIGNVPEYLKKEAGSFGQASDGSWGVTGGKPNRISISSLAKGYKSFYDRNNRSSLHGIAIVAPDGEIMNYELDSNTGEEYFTYASAKVKGIQRGETSAAFLFSQGIHRIVYIHKLLNITRNLYDYKFQPDQYYTATAEMAFLVEPHQIVVELFKDNTLVPLNRTDVTGGYTLSSPNSNISVNVEIIHKTRIVKTIIDFKTMNEGGVDDSGQYHIQYKIKTGVMNDPVEQIRYTTAKSMVLKYDPVIVTKLRGLVSIAVSNIRLQAGTVAISSSIEAVVAELFMLRLGISVSDYPIKISVRHIAPLGALTLFATNESSSKKGVISFNLNSISPDKPEDIIVEIAHEAAHAVANIEGAFGYGPFFAHGKRFLQTNLLLRYLLGVPVTENWTKFTNAYGIQVYGIGYSQETKGMANAERLAFDGHLLDESIQAAYGAPEKSRYTTKLGTIGGDNPAEKDMWNRTPSMDAVPGESLNAGINDLHPESPDISEDPTSKIYKDFRYESKLISQEDIDYGLYPQEDLDKKAPVRVRFKLNNNLIQDLNGNMVRANNYYVVSWVV